MSTLIFDELCSRFLKFAYKCVSHDSMLVRSVAYNGIIYGRGYSLLGRNVSLCLERYHISVSDVLRTSSVHSFVQGSVDPGTLASADFLIEVLKLRDGVLVLPPGELSFISDNFTDIVKFICTSEVVSPSLLCTSCTILY